MRSNQLSYLAIKRVSFLRLFLSKFGTYLLSHPKGSTIGVKGLNFSVRYGKRWIPFAIGTF